jgi:hypothetical protein
MAWSAATTVSQSCVCVCIAYGSSADFMEEEESWSLLPQRQS